MAELPVAYCQPTPEVFRSLKQILTLALPVTFSYLLLMTMGLVDLAFVRYVGTTATGAVGLAGALFGWAMTIGLGGLAGLDYFVSTQFGAGKLQDCRHYLGQGLWLALFAGVPASVALYALSYQLEYLGIHPDVLPETGSFLRIVAPGLFPVFLFTACRNYLQAMSRPLPAFFLLFTANGLNVVFNWVFVFGKLGLPAMGADGCAVASTLCRVFLAVGIAAYIAWTDGRGPVAIRWSDLRLRLDSFGALVKMGLPASMQMALEMGVFGLSTVLAGRLVPASLAAHQIVLNIASSTFMVPLGVGSATAVLVGQALGANRLGQAARTGWLGLYLGTGFMLVAGGALIGFRGLVLSPFSSDSEVLATAMGLVVIAAAFQLVDGIQAVLTGALRGLGDTRTPVAANLLGHWLIGLPISLWLCFRLEWGVSGLWMGLAAGLFVVAGALFLVWIFTLRRGRLKGARTARV